MRMTRQMLDAYTDRWRMGDYRLHPASGETQNNKQHKTNASQVYRGYNSESFHGDPPRYGSQRPWDVCPFYGFVISKYVPLR